MPNMPSDAWGMLMVLLASTIPICGNYLLNKRQTRYLEGRHIALKEDVNEVRDQVSNSHDTNLRDDLDKIGDKVDDIDRRTRRIGDEIRRDRDDFKALRKDTYRAIDKSERIIAKYHPDET